MLKFLMSFCSTGIMILRFLRVGISYLISPNSFKLSYDYVVIIINEQNGLFIVCEYYLFDFFVKVIFYFYFPLNLQILKFILKLYLNTYVTSS